MVRYSAGIVTAYGAAKRAGYTGTYEDFCRQQAEYAENAAAVEQAKTTAVNAAATATTKAGEATTAATAAQTAKTQTEAAASQALTDISTARSGAISAVQTEGQTQTVNARAQAQAAATSATTASTKASEASASATSAGQSATNAAASATSAAQSASNAQDVLESIPADYSALSANVSQLHESLGKFTVTETEDGDIFSFSENDGVISVSASADVTVGNRNIVPNVLNVITGNEYTSKGITYVKNADGSITVNGTATGNVSIYVSNKVQYLTNGRYTISGCPAGGSNATYKLVCNLYNGVSASSWLNDFGNGATGIIDSTIESIQMYFYIASGTTINATVYPMLELGSTPSTYVKAVNNTVTANTDIPITGDTTIWSTSEFTLTKRLSKSEVMVSELTEDVTENAQNIASNAANIAVLTASATERLHHFNPNEYSPVCVHHDNFSRTMTGHEIGMNAGGNDVGNNYEYVTASDYNDGLTVDDGATFAVDNTRTNAFSLRKIASAHSADFVFETNTPTTNKPVCFGYNVTDIKNFVLVTITKRNDGFSMNIRKIKNGSFDEFIVNINIYNIVANVCAFYVVKGWLYIYLDEQLTHSAYVGDMGTYLYLASYKGYETHFDFVNVFNLANKVEWNPNHVLDTGVSNIPLIKTSANEGGYILQNIITRWSDYADKFVLHSTDEMVHNGIRAERSIANPSKYTGNLRNLKLTFDVYFPSTSSDTKRRHYVSNAR